MFEVQEPNAPPLIGYDTTSRHATAEKALEVAHERAYPGRTVQVIGVTEGVVQPTVWTVQHVPGLVEHVSDDDVVTRKPGRFIVTTDSRTSPTELKAVTDAQGVTVAAEIVVGEEVGEVTQTEVADRPSEDNPEPQPVEVQV